MHLWWARRPLAACRAVLFASIVDDPSSRPEEFPTEESQEAERQRLFRIIERLVLWENTNNEEVLDEARQEILNATDGHPPPVLDPFCGGGSIPLEAQRLGMDAHASDLNPVAVLITKALIEIPSKFAGHPPVNPDARNKMQKKIQGQDWPGASGLADDVRYYGKWMSVEAEKRIGHLYPKAKLSDGTEATIIAWLWARTVKCPNPACGAMMPLIKSFSLSTKSGRKAWVEPQVDDSKNPPRIRFVIKAGQGLPPDPPKVGRGAKFQCLACGQVAPDSHVKAEGMAGRMDVQLMAMVAEGTKGRIYLPPDEEQSRIARQAEPTWRPEFRLADDRRAIWCPLYGLETFDKLFTSRQLVALTTFSDLVSEAREKATQDSITAGLPDDDAPLNDEGTGARAYGDAIATYLGLALSKLSDSLCSLATWKPSMDQAIHVFTRQALPMVWDFAESNVFNSAAGDYTTTIQTLWRVINNFQTSQSTKNTAIQKDSVRIDVTDKKLVSTDPPYYDNIGYADLSDFFYVWLRRSLARIHPDIFGTLLVPKTGELVAAPYRFNGSKEEAERFFEEGLGKSFEQIRKVCRADFPLTVFYAYKQAEEDEGNEGLASTGWEVMLECLVESGYAITGTWPMRTELTNRSISRGTNSLASSILLVCRPRPDDAPIGTRKEFISALKRKLPEALRQLQEGNIAPVDLAQAAIGPGMAIFSRYSKILEADGSPMRVRTALQLINQNLDEYLSQQENEYDPDTRWALSWFEQYSMNEGPFGDAETLSKAKNTSVQGMVEAGILKAVAGKAQLLRREEMDQAGTRQQIDV